MTSEHPEPIPDQVLTPLSEGEYRVAFSSEYGNYMVIDSEHSRHAQAMERADAQLLADAMNARAAALADVPKEAK